mgnify:FL=1|jgi:predicted GNAT family N-acyltransferase
MADSKRLGVESMRTIVKEPNQCSEIEIEKFIQLVVEGGEVSTVGLRNRIKKAKNLIFIEQDSQCVAIGAVKVPNLEYKNKVFMKAGVTQFTKFMHELGWIYVTEAARGKGHGRNLVFSALRCIPGACFATTREDNESMHKLFNEFKFSKAGKPYKSQSGDHQLVLYTKE